MAEIEEEFPGTRREQKRGYDGKFRYDSDIITNEVWATITTTTDASLPVYDVPTGKRFHLRTVILYHADATDQQVELHMSGSTLVVPLAICSGPTMVAKTDIVGPYWDDGVYVNMTSWTTASPLQISIGGILEPKE